MSAVSLSELELYTVRLEPETLVFRRLKEVKSILGKSGDEKRGVLGEFPLYAKTLGSDLLYAFTVIEILENRLYVLCSDLSRYSFQPQTTLLDCTLRLGSEETFAKLLCKIESVHKSSEDDSTPAGFVLRIVQQSLEDYRILDQFVRAHNGTH